MKMSQYFLKSLEVLDVNVNVDLSNYATKIDLKNVTDGDVSSFAVKKIN